MITLSTAKTLKEFLVDPETTKRALCYANVSPADYAIYTENNYVRLPVISLWEGQESKIYFADKRVRDFIEAEFNSNIHNKLDLLIKTLNDQKASR